MIQVTVRDLFKNEAAYLNQTIQVSGWIRTVRDSKTFGFIELNDGSFFTNLQIVFDDNLANFAEVVKFGISTAIIVSGQLVESPGAKQPFELKATAIELEGSCPGDYPLQKKRHSFEYLRTIAHLRPRTNTFAAVFRIRSLVAFAIHKFFQERNFVYVHTPIITGSDCEGAGEMFRVTTLDLENLPRTKEGIVDYSEDFFAKETNLTVSGQLEAETYCMAFRNVYTFGPTFRAENSNTARHASEFWMIEPEIAFADLDDDMDLIERSIKFCIQYVLDHCPDEMAFFNAFIDKTVLEKLHKVLAAPFTKMEYTKGIALLQEAVKNGHKFENNEIYWGMDLQSEHERYLTEEIVKGPMFLINYPKEIKAFYMRENEDGKTVAACDLLVPGEGEIVGGSQREERYDVLKAKMDKIGNTKGLEWYLNLRKYGGCKHAGFGIGFDRLLMYITGVANIRDTEPYPRTSSGLKY